MLLAAVSTVIELDVQTLNLISGAVIPLLVGLVTKKVASQGLKAVLNALLSTLAGAVSVAIAASGTIVVGEVITSMITTFIASTALYYGVWKPTGVAGTVADIAPERGLGSPPLPDMETEDVGEESVETATDPVLENKEPADAGDHSKPRTTRKPRAKKPQ